MNIDLIYFYRPYSSNYFLYGPEKVNNNIVVNSDGVLVFSSESAVFNKIDEMCASLSPDVTNINVKSSVEFSGGFKMRVYSGVLNVSSDVPDYTEILTSINSNLSLTKDNILKISNCFCANTNDINATSFIRRLLVSLTGTTSTADNNLINGGLSVKVSQLMGYISSLNSNIHNDLTQINTTTENKDTVLIVDGQQDFVIRKQDIDD